MPPDRIHLLSSVASTNETLRDLAAAGAPEPTLVVAERQTAGRGRRGRTWHSPTGLGIYLSLLYRPSGPTATITRWTLAAAVAACETTRAWCGVPVSIKWPNDLVLAGRKLGGILAELRSAGPGRSDLILGTGLNVAHGSDDFPPELREVAGSLRGAAGAGILEAAEREAWIAGFVARMNELAGALRADRWSSVAERWESLAPDGRGRQVRVLDAGGVEAFRGMTEGLAEDGALRVRRADGVPVAVRTAESVRTID